jgi:hypothetical protein
MREIYKAGITPQQKLVGVNNRFGNTDIKFQQGTTRCLYDSLPFTAAAQTFRFFEDSASRNFPFSNTGSDGNKLGVGETMVIEKILFQLATYDPDTNRYTNFANSSLLLNDGKFDINIGNQTVLKDFPISSNLTYYNDDYSGSNFWFGFDTDIVIPPLISFYINTQLGNAGVPAANVYLRCFIIGTAGILAPRTTF